MKFLNKDFGKLQHKQTHKQSDGHTETDANKTCVGVNSNNNLGYIDVLHTTGKN